MSILNQWTRLVVSGVDVDAMTRSTVPRGTESLLPSD
jgi:hypothetical protein